jgi:hypothetical protein
MAWGVCSLTLYIRCSVCVSTFHAKLCLFTDMKWLLAGHFFLPLQVVYSKWPPLFFSCFLPHRGCYMPIFQTRMCTPGMSIYISMKFQVSSDFDFLTRICSLTIYKAFCMSLHFLSKTLPNYWYKMIIGGPFFLTKHVIDLMDF